MTGRVGRVNAVDEEANAGVGASAVEIVVVSDADVSDEAGS